MSYVGAFLAIGIVIEIHVHISVGRRSRNEDLFRMHSMADDAIIVFGLERWTERVRRVGQNVIKTGFGTRPCTSKGHLEWLEELSGTESG